MKKCNSIFLGYSYQPRLRKCKTDGKLRTVYAAEISKSNQQKVREAIKEAVNWKNTSIGIEQIATNLNPKLRGWINYYGLYSKDKLRTLMYCLEKKITKWIRSKYKMTSVKASYMKLMSIKRSKPTLFYHWEVRIM